MNCIVLSFDEEANIYSLIFNKSFISFLWIFISLIALSFFKSYTFNKFLIENNIKSFFKGIIQVALLFNDICFSTSQNFINLYLIKPISFILNKY